LLEGSVTAAGDRGAEPRSLLTYRSGSERSLKVISPLVKAWFAASAREVTSSFA
jgi:hypothetical protein